jgi:hypothetical protein
VTQIRRIVARSIGPGRDVVERVACTVVTEVGDRLTADAAWHGNITRRFSRQ